MVELFFSVPEQVLRFGICVTVSVRRSRKLQIGECLRNAATGGQRLSKPKVSAEISRVAMQHRA